MFYRSVRDKGLIRLRISGEAGELCKYTRPACLDEAEQVLLHRVHASIKTRYLKKKKQKNGDQLVYATFGLLRSNRAPKYIGYMELKERRARYIRVAVGQADHQKAMMRKFNLNQYADPHHAYIEAVEWLAGYLAISEEQKQVLLDAWPAFLAAYPGISIASA